MYVHVPAHEGLVYETERPKNPAAHLDVTDEVEFAGHQYPAVVLRDIAPPAVGYDHRACQGTIAHTSTHATHARARREAYQSTAAPIVAHAYPTGQLTPLGLTEPAGQYRPDTAVHAPAQDEFR